MEEREIWRTLVDVGPATLMHTFSAAFGVPSLLGFQIEMIPESEQTRDATSLPAIGVSLRLKSLPRPSPLSSTLQAPL